ncbi:MAG: HD domain-containing protein [Candidatus Magasanikbacteria bacterium]
MPLHTNEVKTFKKLIEDLPKKEKEYLLSVLDYTLEHHGLQKRKSGEPYIIHPVGVAIRVFEKYHDIELTIAALLHDIVEDCKDVSVADIYKRFGDVVGFLVESVTKRLEVFYKYPEVDIKDRIERLIWSGLKDVRVLLLKIADRENNLKTIHHLKDRKQIRMAFETQAVYTPLRRILHYNHCHSVVCSKERFMSFLEKENLKTPLEIKEYLIRESFENIDSDMFGLVYDDTESIIWHITSFDTFKRICETKTLGDVIDFITVEGNPDMFKATFKFKKGAVVPTDIKMGVSSYSK